MIDLQRLIDSTQLRGVTVKVEYPGIPGFKVEVAFCGKQEMLKIYDSCTERVYNTETRKTEQEIDRRKMASVWAERVVKGWEGLTIGRMKKLWPIKVESEVKDDTPIEPSIENRISLLWNSTDFENWVLTVATSPGYFEEARAKAETEIGNLEK